MIVDDGSGPEHEQAIRSAVGKVSNGRLLTQANAGPAAARNRGYRAGSGELVAFIDDDCAPRADWLVHLIEPFAGAPDLAAVGGRVVSAPPENWVGRFLAAVDYATGLQDVFENAATANACYRRSVLDELGGFDETFKLPGGDDPDLSERTRRAGYRLEFVPDAIVDHRELESYGEFVRHMYGRGLGEARLGRKHGRRSRVALRAALAPVYLSRMAAGTWRRTFGRGGTGARVAWTSLQLAGSFAFLAGSVVGLARER